MFWGILDAILWVAAIVLFICSYTMTNFIFFIIGLICLVLAVVLLSILVGKGNLIESLFEIFD
jgi:hypothetical protein